jgi:hypothetical protein
LITLGLLLIGIPLVVVVVALVVRTLVPLWELLSWLGCLYVLAWAAMVASCVSGVVILAVEVLSG